MVATWAIGKNAVPFKVADKLKTAPFDAIVIRLSSAVAGDDAIAQFFMHFANLTIRGSPHENLISEITRQKFLCEISDRVYCLVHRAKVEACKVRAWELLCRSERRSRGTIIQYGTVSLDRDCSRQRMPHITIGILNIEGEVSRDDTYEIAQKVGRWIVLDRVALLSGFFGNNQRLVEMIATNACAIYREPFCQEFSVWNDRLRQYEKLVHRPTFWLSDSTWDNHTLTPQSRIGGLVTAPLWVTLA